MIVVKKSHSDHSHVWLADFKWLRSPSRSPSLWKLKRHPRRHATHCLEGSPSLPLHHRAPGGITPLSLFYSSSPLIASHPSFSTVFNHLPALPPSFHVSFHLPPSLLHITEHHNTQSAVESPENPRMSTKSMAAHVPPVNTELWTSNAHFPSIPISVSLGPGIIPSINSSPEAHLLKESRNELILDVWLWLVLK